MNIDAHRARMLANGNSIGEATGNSTKNSINNLFKDSPFYRTVFVDGTEIETRVITEKNPNMFTTTQSEQRSFVFRPDTTIVIGKILTMDDEMFIIYDGNENNIFPKYFAIKSNNNIKIKTGETKTISSYDLLGRPIYTTTPNYVESLCYATINAKFNVYTEFDSHMNLPEGRILVFFPYTDQKLKDGMEFEMFDTTYTIINVDLTKIRNTEGIVSIFAKVVT